VKRIQIPPAQPCSLFLGPRKHGAFDATIACLQTEGETTLIHLLYPESRLARVLSVTDKPDWSNSQRDWRNFGRRTHLHRRHRSKHSCAGLLVRDISGSDRLLKSRRPGEDAASLVQADCLHFGTRSTEAAVAATVPTHHMVVVIFTPLRKPRNPGVALAPHQTRPSWSSNGPFRPKKFRDCHCHPGVRLPALLEELPTHRRFVEPRNPWRPQAASRSSPPRLCHRNYARKKSRTRLNPNPKPPSTPNGSSQRPSASTFHEPIPAYGRKTPNPAAALRRRAPA